MPSTTSWHDMTWHSDDRPPPTPPPTALEAAAALDPPEPRPTSRGPTPAGRPGRHPDFLVGEHPEKRTWQETSNMPKMVRLFGSDPTIVPGSPGWSAGVKHARHRIVVNKYLNAEAPHFQFQFKRHLSLKGLTLHLVLRVHVGPDLWHILGQISPDLKFKRTAKQTETWWRQWRL